MRYILYMTNESANIPVYVSKLIVKCTKSTSNQEPKFFHGNGINVMKLDPSI